MAKLTKAQSDFVKQLNKARGVPWFRRNINTGKEECFIGAVRVNRRLFFFFYDIGYLKLEDTVEKRKYKYFDMKMIRYKLDEYLEN